MKICILIVFLLVSIPLFASDIEVTWNANTESDLAGYKVFWGNSAGSYPNSMDVGKNLIYTIPNVTNGQTYYIVLKAYDVSGNISSPSTEVSLYIPIPDMTPPPVPTNIITSVAGSVVALKWTAVVASDLASYGVYDNNVLIGSATKDKAEFVTGSLVEGSHSFTVDSVDTTGNRSAKSAAKVVTIDVTSPKPPTGIKLKILQLLAWLGLTKK